jgi:hypothetical protein
MVELFNIRHVKSAKENPRKFFIRSVCARSD